MKNPASKARKYLDDLGLSITNADGSLKSLSAILQVFNAAGITAANATDVFQKRVASTFIQLEAAQGSLADFTKELDSRTGTAAKIAAKNLEGLNGELTKLKSAWEGLQIAFADAGLLEAATGLVAGIGKVVSSLAEMSAAAKKTILVVAGIVAAVGPAIYIFGQLAGSVAALVGLPVTLSALGSALAGPDAVANPNGADVAAVAARGANAHPADESFRKFVGNLLGGAVRDLRNTFAPLISGIADLIGKALLPVLALHDPRVGPAGVPPGPLTSARPRHS